MLTKKQRDLLLFIHHRIQEEGIPPSFDEMKDALDLKSKSGIHRLITALEERGFIRRLPNRARALEIVRLPEGHEERMLAGQSSYDEIGSGSHIGSAATSAPFSPTLAKSDDNKADGNVENMSALARRGFTPSVIDGGPATSGQSVDAATSTAGNSSSDHNIISGEFREDPQSGYDANSTQIPVMGRIAAGVPISAIENQSNSLSVPPDMIGAGEYFALEVEGDSMIEAGIHTGDTVIIHKTSSATVGDIIVAFIDEEEATLKRFRRQGNSIALEAANPAFETRVYDQQRVKVQGRLVGLLRRYQ